MATNAIDDEETFVNSDKVVSVINVLTKYKIKLWEMPDLSSTETTSEVFNFLINPSYFKILNESR